MIYLTNNQKIYIAALVVGAVLLLIGTCFFTFKRIYLKKRYHEDVYLKLSKTSELNDYLLLNNYRVEFDDRYYGVIDHLLISKKYIYIINDFDISGVVSGDLKDLFLRVVTSKDKAINVSNPLNYNINLIKRLNVYHHLDQSLIKGIVVINNDSKINVTGSNNQFLIIKRNELLKYIKKFDKDDIGNLKEKDVVNFINKLDKENQRKNNG